LLLLDGRSLPSIAFRAATTVGRGTPASGTGTATHSSLGFFLILRPLEVFTLSRRL
jgi:hypothetical protein